MALKVFEDKKITSLVTKTNDSLPNVKKLAEDLDFELLRTEYLSFSAHCAEHGHAMEYRNKITDEQIDDLKAINFFGEFGGLYNQTQLAIPSDDGNWNTYCDHVGEYTQEVLNSFGNIYRPRYVIAKPGWEILPHNDWDNSADYGFRCHLMIATTDDCKHYVYNDQDEPVEYIFRKGEAWFFNVEKKHYANNLSEFIRASISFELLSDELLS